MTSDWNDPCPCGSGKEYSRCCLATAAAEEPPELATWRRIRRALDEPSLCARMMAFLAEECSGYDLFPDDSWREFLCDDEELINSLHFSPRSPLFAVYSSWYFHFWSATPGRHQLRNLSLFGVPPTQHFLASHPGLEPTVREYLRACLRSEYSFYEILSCSSGRGVTCRDIFSGHLFEVTRGDKFAELEPHLVMYFNLVQIHGITMIEATGPFPIDAPTGERLPDFLQQLDISLPESSSISNRSARARLLYLLMIQSSPAPLFSPRFS